MGGSVSMLSSFGPRPSTDAMERTLASISRYDAATTTSSEPGLLAVAVDRAHALFLPDDAPAVGLSSALSRIAALAGDPRRTLAPTAASPCDDSTAEAIVSAAQANSSVALFSLDLRSLLEDSLSRCPSSSSEALSGDLCSTVAAMLHPLGSAHRLGDNACLCAFYCRGSCDPELAATQVTRTLRARFGLSALSEACIMRFAAVQLGDGALEAIRAFIHGA